METSGVEPMAGVNITSMPMRKDVVTAENMVDKILKNAPDIACNMFVVPKVVE